MTDAKDKQNPEFDAFADNYDEALQQGLSLTGESKEYFASERVRWMQQILRDRGASTRHILDFGCGTGGSIPYLSEAFSPETLIGTDVSEDSLKIASAVPNPESYRFERLDQYQPQADRDLAFCNGVFHHIPPSERSDCAATVFKSLAPGGLFCFWENNPWNPGTRWVMSRVPFDRDAIMLWPGEARKLLASVGFHTPLTSYRFFFPNALRWFRPCEKALSRVPLGGQYLILAQKPRRAER